MKKTSLVILGLLVQFAMQAATPSQIIKEVKQAVAPDGRQVVFEVEMKGNVLRGVTSEPRAREALVTRLKGEGVRFTDSLRVYPQDQWAIVRIPVASMRTRGAHAGEMATQAIMGMPVRLFEKKGEWWRATIRLFSRTASPACPLWPGWPSRRRGPRVCACLRRVCARWPIGPGDRHGANL